jgi:hypothetical protein
MFIPRINEQALGSTVLLISVRPSEPVNIDWINVEPETGKSTRWDF